MSVKEIEATISELSVKKLTEVMSRLVEHQTHDKARLAGDDLNKILRR